MKTPKMPRSTELTSDLIKSAYKTDDSDVYWKIIHELRGRGSKVEFNAAKHLVKSDDTVDREIGADILGQLDWPEKKFHDDCVLILIELLKDNEPDVIASAAFSLGHRNDLRAVTNLIKLVGHDSAWVRYGVAFGLIGLEDETAVDALILLSRDSDFDVRNWATFGLGSLCEIDTPELRNALFERITDDEHEIRGEALVGLATRKDIKVFDAVMRELEGEFYGNWAVQAAGLLESPDFINVLEKLKLRLAENTEDRFLDDIDDAISACKQTVVAQ
jgi:HEAT repeat protein